MSEEVVESEAAVEEAGFDGFLYRQARQELHTPKPAQTAPWLFLALFFLFVAGQLHELTSLSGIVVLVLAVLFHEAGHAVGMRLFGFRDVRMFFIPFFGAVAQGRPRGVAAWKEALVSLLGPLPGILVGIGCLLVTKRNPTELGVITTYALLLINALNLLPFGFLDGGRFLERVIFSRHRILEITFQALGSLLILFFAFASSLYVLALFAVLVLVRLPRRWQILQAAAALRQSYPALVDDPEKLGESEGRAVFAAVRALLKAPAREHPPSLAATMEAIINAAKPIPGALATAGLLALYALGVVGAALGIAGLFK